MLQWNKWSDAATELLTIQLEAAMRSSLMHLAASYRDKIRDWKTNFRIPKRHSRKQEKKPQKHRLQKRRRRRTKRRNPKARQRPPPRLHEKKKSAPVKPKAGGLFGAKKPKKTYEGEPGGKAEWFLEEALDTVYDPHGTGKPVKGAMILARSSEGNCGEGCHSHVCRGG